MLSDRQVLVNLGEDQWRMWNVLKVDENNQIEESEDELSKSSQNLEFRDQTTANFFSFDKSKNDDRDYEVEYNSVQDHANRNEITKATPGELMSRSKREVVDHDGIEIEDIIQRRKKR